MEKLSNGEWKFTTIEEENSCIDEVETMDQSSFHFSSDDENQQEDMLMQPIQISQQNELIRKQTIRENAFKKISFKDWGNGLQGKIDAIKAEAAAMSKVIVAENKAAKKGPVCQREMYLKMQTFVKGRIEEEKFTFEAARKL
jgi:hypothetical protein